MLVYTCRRREREWKEGSIFEREWKQREMDKQKEKEKVVVVVGAGWAGLYAIR